MRFGSWLFVATALSLAGCYDPTLADGTLRCAAGNVCPSGLECGGDGRCYHPGHLPGPDGGSTPDFARGDDPTHDQGMAIATTFSSTPPDPSFVSSATFAFSANQAGATFQCRVDSDAYAACTSPFTVKVSDGVHTFDVFATAPGGSVETPAQSFTWKTDSASPHTTLSATPAALTKETSASFTFSGNHPGTTFVCRIDGAAYASCTSPFTQSVGAGMHTFNIYGTDGNGLVEKPAVAYSWTVDLTPPKTTITKAPQGLVASASASLTFTADETATFECQLDGGAFAACTSPASYDKLPDGAHTFVVRATDGAGNVESPGATAGWTSDATPPHTTLTAGPVGATNHTTASFTWTSADSDTASFECRLDGAAFAACAGKSKSFTGLSFAAHTFEVRAVDTAGNRETPPAARTWTVANGPLIELAFDGNGNNSGALGATYNAVITGGTFTAGKVGSAIKFNSTSTNWLNENASVPNTASLLSSGTRYTIALWYREDVALGIDPPNGHFPTLLTFRGRSGPPNGGIETYHGVNSSCFNSCYSGATPDASTCGACFDAAVGSWHHVMIEYAASSTTTGGGADVLFYIDGNFTTPQTLSNPNKSVIFNPGQAPSLLLGQNSNLYIDEVKLFDDVMASNADRCSRVVGGTWNGASCVLP